MHIYKLIHQVHDKFRGLCVRLSEKTGLSDEWYRSHGYKPKTLDAFGNGAKCKEVHDFVDFCELYESGAKGAGVYLARLVAAEIVCRAVQSGENCSQRTVRRELLKEASEAVQALDRKEFNEMSVNDLNETWTELNDLAAALENAQKQVHNEIMKREIAADNQLRAA